MIRNAFTFKGFLSISALVYLLANCQTARHHFQDPKNADQSHTGLGKHSWLSFTRSLIKKHAPNCPEDTADLMKKTKKSNKPIHSSSNSSKNSKTSSLNPLAGWVRHGNLEKIQDMLNAGSIDLNEKDNKNGKHLLSYAMELYEEEPESGDKDAYKRDALAVIKLLVENGADPRLAGKTDYQRYDNILILRAAAMQNQELMEILLSKDPEAVNVIDNHGRTVLHAIFNHKQRGLNVSFLEYILTKIASGACKESIVNHRKRYLGRAAIHYAVKHDLKVLGLIINAGADVNIQDCEGNTPLHYAIGKTGFTSLADIKDRVKLLIDKGANAYKKNNQGESAYDSSKKMLNHKTSTPLQRKLREEMIGLCKPAK